MLLDDEDDINQVVDYFSYEHFYVIYCKFWELDKDHDLFISKDDLAKHNDHGKYTVSTHIEIKNIFYLMTKIIAEWKISSSTHLITGPDLDILEQCRHFSHIRS